jgi:UDP-2-acetamido-3-amino-2,3-dideoxy-glucuronate N-acetyltransferase
MNESMFPSGHAYKVARERWAEQNAVELGEGAAIHIKAHVRDSRVGARSRVWQFASVIRGAVVGADCNIASGACLDGSTIGDRCILGHNVAMGPGFSVADDVFIGPNVVLCNDAWPRAHKRGFDAGRFGEGQHAIRIESGATVGAGCVILPGVWIGHGAMIAAGVTVTKDVPGNMILCRSGALRLIEDEGREVEQRMRFAHVYREEPYT